MCDVVFIQPALSQQERYGISFKAGGQTPPTGLALLAAVLRERGWSVGLLDAAALGLSVQETVQQALMLNPTVVGLTAVSISVHHAHEVAQGIRNAAPHVKTVLGGSHVTGVPEETLRRFPAFDLAVLGEGEITFPEVLKAWREGREDLSDVPGVLFRRGDALVRTADRPPILDLDSLPFPAWDLLPDLARHYSPPAHTVRRYPAALLVPSRGCAGHCIFCDNRVFGRMTRCYSAGVVLRMIRHLQETYGIREVQFRDDNLMAFRPMLEELCHRLIDEHVDLTWSCAARVDMADAELLALMKKAGCHQIWYGIESGSDRILRMLCKQIDVATIRKAVEQTHRAGIDACGFFMIGNPTETEADIHATMDLLLELPFSEFHISHFTPFPGSAIFRTAASYGSFDDRWEILNGWTTCFVPATLSRERLIHYSNLAFRKFYLRPRILWATLLKIRSFRHARAFFFASLGFFQYVLQKRR